ncbi:transmembrane protein 236 [Acanthochromis polyacanthus]|uniref:transmembrane protein 236 n=1 Tax=Acanthochromis polyacanthus TaxID=80966 RepID=UPI002234897B|nr:transmembrane protein 236 [Acanthochromis polyacanthus]
MPSGKTLKLILYELLQFAALITPVFVIMERFADLISHLKGRNQTTYWLVVAVSIASMTSVTLLVWVPLRYLTLKKRRFIKDITQWRPTMLAYLILCTLPCFAILIASSKVQVDNGIRLDYFTELPVSMVLSFLVCADIIERIRPCRLLGQSDNQDPDFDMSGPVLTRLEQVTTVSGQLHPDEGQNGLTQGQPVASNGSISGRWENGTDLPRRSPLSARAPGTAYLYSPSSRPPSYSGRLASLWRRDGRSELFVDSFLFWFDTVELVRVAGLPDVFFSAWVFPVYILAFLSTLRMIITPHSPLLSLAGVALQDFPFFVFRVALIAVFGFITPVLYPLKNVLVCLTFIYFTFLTKLRIFRSETMF